MIRFTAAIVAPLLFASSTARAQGTTTAESQITTTGRGEIRIKPSTAVVSFTVQVKGATAAGVASENATLVAQTTRSLLGAGLRQDSISNFAYSVGPNYEFNSGGRKQEGFIATNVLRVEVSNIANVGKIIDAGLSGGATQVSSAQYSGENMDSARQDALRAAVSQARRDAETLAAAAGGSLGRLINLTTSGNAPAVPPEVYMSMSAASVPTMTRPNDVTVTAVATGRWEFVPRK